MLAGCQSTDKKESYFDISGITNARFEFDNTTNKTNVTWTTTLTNGTIYNLKSFSVKFKLYNDSTLVNIQTFDYNLGIKHGKDYSGVFRFYVIGQIDSIEYVSWTADYETFWNTYKIWIIVMIALSGVASIAYIIVMISQDLDLGDTVDAIVDFFEDHGWVAICFLIPLAGTIWGFATSNWIPVLIVIGGIVAFIILALVAHLIKYMVDNTTFGKSCVNNDYDVENDYDFDPTIEDVDDYIGDKEKLSLFSAEELKNYCRNNGLRGFSSLNKAGIIDLIVSKSIESTDDEQTNRQVEKCQKNVFKRIGFDDIAGLEDAKQAFKEKIVLGFEHKDLYEKYGKKVGGGILLYGLPGTGKTLFAEATSNEIDALFIPIKCSDIKSKWYGESETNVKKIFDKARRAKKAIIFFDEFEAIGARRSDDSDNGNNDLVPQILAEMQGIGSSNTNSIVMVIAATNKPWAIDSAFLRPGRFDEKIYVPLPDFSARKRLFELKLQGIPQEDLNFDYLAEITKNFNGADIGAFCDKLKMSAINRSIETNIDCPITMKDVDKVKSMIKSSVSDEDIEKLTQFRDLYR